MRFRLLPQAPVWPLPDVVGFEPPAPDPGDRRTLREKVVADLSERYANHPDPVTNEVKTRRELQRETAGRIGGKISLTTLDALDEARAIVWPPAAPLVGPLAR